MGIFHGLDETAREVAEQAHHRLNTALHRGEDYSELDDAISPMDEVVGELRSALEEAEELRVAVSERAEGLREHLDPDREGPESGELDGPLEERHEDAE